MSLPDFAFIETEDQWATCIERLHAAQTVAVDFEANSLYVYREQICLMQFSIPGQDYIVDPLADFELTGLGQLFADPEKEKIFHACEYDLILLKQHYDWEVTNLFDTMWAARVLGYTNMGLAWLLEEFYGVKLAKKYQRADWGKRPLKPEMLAYAQCDTHYLPRLREHLADKLQQQGLYEEAQELFEEATRVKLPQRLPIEDKFWSVRGVRQLSGRAQAVMRELYCMRDKISARRDVPAFKVISNQLLLLVAEKQPQTMDDLLALDGLSHKLTQRLGRRMLDAVQKGMGAAVPKPIKTKKRPQAVAQRFMELQEWRKLTARNRGIESDVVISRDAMWALAEANPGSHEALVQLALLGSCRLEKYADELLDCLSNGLATR